jgi:hypothetical protein
LKDFLVPGIKVKFTLEENMKAQRRGRYSSTLFLISVLDGGWVVNATPRQLYPREGDRYPLYGRMCFVPYVPVLNPL